jgi:hypothetical protein
LIFFFVFDVNYGVYRGKSVVCDYRVSIWQGRPISKPTRMPQSQQNIKCSLPSKFRQLLSFLTSLKFRQYFMARGINYLNIYKKRNKKTTKISLKIFKNGMCLNDQKRLNDNRAKEENIKFYSIQVFKKLTFIFMKLET